MNYDFAIVYWGLTRSVVNTHASHTKYVFDILKKHNLTYKIFMHTWKTKDDTQFVWESISHKKIDYQEYKLLHPNIYTLDDQDEFLKGIDMDNYFYKDVWEKKGHSGDGEWLPQLVTNHICALESQKRGFAMVEQCFLNGEQFKRIMFIRPDVKILNELPIQEIISTNDMIHIPNHNHGEGMNDQFAITNYTNAKIYSNRINEIAEFRKTNGRIVSEKYVKYILSKYNIQVNELDFKYQLIRP
jgi:hypothetical protein